MGILNLVKTLIQYVKRCTVDMTTIRLCNLKLKGIPLHMLTYKFIS